MNENETQAQTTQTTPATQATQTLLNQIESLQWDLDGYAESITALVDEVRVALEDAATQMRARVGYFNNTTFRICQALSQEYRNIGWLQAEYSKKLDEDPLYNESEEAAKTRDLIRIWSYIKDSNNRPVVEFDEPIDCPDLSNKDMVEQLIEVLVMKEKGDE